MNPSKFKECKNEVETTIDIVRIEKKSRFYILATEHAQAPLAFTCKETGEEYVVAFSQEKYAEQFLYNSNHPYIDESLFPIPVVLNDIDMLNGDGLYVYMDKDGTDHFIDANKEAKWDFEHQKEFEFIVHSVIDDNLTEDERFDPILSIYNDTHTHGCCNYDHMEFQIVRNPDLEESRKLLDIMYNLVKLGARFKPGDTVGEFISLACFQDHTTPTEHVLRIIRADSNGKFPWEEGCEESYKLQMEDKW